MAQTDQRARARAGAAGGHARVRRLGARRGEAPCALPARQLPRRPGGVGQRGLNLYCVNPLLAKQTHEDTTIGGMADRSWIPHFVDEYTGVDFQWA